MKALGTILFVLILAQSGQTQCDNVVESTYKHELEDMDISHRPDMTFYSFNNFDAGYVLNGGNGIQTPVIFQGGIWMGGINNAGDIRASARAYTDFTDYSAGLLDDDTGSIENEACVNWDRFFKVTANEIAQVKADYDDDGVMNEQIPDNVLYYPAIGNMFFADEYGFELPEENLGGLAAFVDRDGNGLYDATMGDYPAARGTESVFWISNDRNEDNNDYVGMEFLVTSSVNTDEVELAFSSQMKIRGIYHGDEVLNDFYLGVWMDADLGCITNDMVGCLPDSNLIFYYGQEQENCLEGNPFNAGTEPLLLMKYDMNGGDKMSSFLSYNRQNISTEPFGTTDPQNSLAVYNGLRAIWKDGESLTYGGEGYNVGSTDVRKFQYNHAENAEPGPWRACDEGQLVRDKRTLVSFGPYNLEPGDIFDLKFSVHLIENAELSCPTEAEILEVCNRIDEIISEVDESIEGAKIALAPNPFSDYVSVGSGAQKFDKIEIYNVSGQVVYQASFFDTNQYELNLGELVEGMYTIRLSLDHQIIGMKKMIKTMN